MHRLTLLLVLPTIVLCAVPVVAQQDHDRLFLSGEIGRLCRMADSLKRQAMKLELDARRYGMLSDSLAKWSKRETELNEYWDTFADSMTMWSKDLFPDSLFKNFQFDSKQFLVPKPRNDDWKLPPYPYPRYFNDPKFPGVPIPDMRTLPDPGNNEPLPRVIPKRRDGNEVPGFPGWRIQKLKNLT